MSRTYKLDLTLRGTEESLRKVLSLLAQLQYNGRVGHSGTWYIHFDGDGSDFLDVQPADLYIDNLGPYGCGELTGKALRELRANAST